MNHKGYLVSSYARTYNLTLDQFPYFRNWISGSILLLAFEGANKNHLFAMTKISPTAYLQTSFRTAPSLQVFNQKFKQEIQPVHHVLTHAEQQLYFSITTQTYKPLLVERNNRKATTMNQRTKRLTWVLCEFKVDIRNRPPLVVHKREKKKKKCTDSFLKRQDNHIWFFPAALGCQHR